jgi:multiple sugar transport system ATP-binding protein
MAKLALRHLAKSFGEVRAVRGLELEVADGELFVLVGPSGSGKSTVLRLIAGLEAVDDGAVLIGGRDVTALDPSKRDVGMVFQSYALFPHRSVRENIGFGLRARRASAIAERVAAVAESLDLTQLLDRLPRQLSGGERQRVALARALVREPDVLLMDEPLSNLDAQLRARARAEIARLQKRVGTTTIYVTHDQGEALSLGHRVGVMNDGALEQVGTPDEVYGEPENLFVAQFMGTPAMNVVRTNGRVLGVRPEHVALGGSRWAGPPPGATSRAVVDLVEPLGDQTHITLEAESGPLIARAEPEFRPAVGDPVDYWFSRTYPFDPETGRRLGA